MIHLIVFIIIHWCTNNWLLFNHEEQYFLGTNCPLGFIGRYCETTCQYPHYGFGCQQTCLCSKTRCNSSTGCVKRDTSKWQSNQFSTNLGLKALVITNRNSLPAIVDARDYIMVCGIKGTCIIFLIKVSLNWNIR